MLKNNKGFTLVELAAIIMILVILATIAIPTFSKFLSNTSDERNQEMGQDIMDYAQVLFMINMQTARSVRMVNV